MVIWRCFVVVVRSALRLFSAPTVTPTPTRPHTPTRTLWPRLITPARRHSFLPPSFTNSPLQHATRVHAHMARTAPSPGSPSSA
ncbi:hypothetical protein B0H15DRAFT_846058 [Mycena belliarum]|uniref:Secreted protein n=1 Tax=Mycena belliarum TaxID=1033014 RepID=A0AAD6XPS9_9AGAR|nr:hypothetical protein B0H15DRAFT_846058 [Mycena belliae]